MLAFGNGHQAAVLARRRYFGRLAARTSDASQATRRGVPLAWKETALELGQESNSEKSIVTKVFSAWRMEELERRYDPETPDDGVERRWRLFRGGS
jgi:hypothetical protein